MKQWYRITNAASDPTVAEINIFDLIGDWIDDWLGWGGVTTAKTFGEELKALPDSVKTIRVHINSPGGDVFSAVTIANMLRDQQQTKGRTVQTFVDGLAASAASIVAMAGSTITMADNALMMIHDPWTCACGNAAELRQFADELDTITKAIIATYKWHSELSEDEIASLMDADTWMDADDAIAKGFATDKVEGLKAAASIARGTLSKLKVPEQYRARVDALLTPEKPAPVAASAVEVLRACREGECLDLAESLLNEALPLDQVQARVSSERAARAKAAKRTTDIRALCEQAKQPELAEGYIRGAMSVDDVRAHLTTITAKLDRVEIDGSLPADQGAAGKPKLDVAAIYAARNPATKKKE